MALPRGGAGSKTPKAPIRVSQATIDKIKRMGMTKALAGSRGASPEMKEGLRRMYGTTRVKAAVKAATPPKFKAPAGANKKPAGRMSKSAAPSKKSSGLSTGLKVTAGAVGAATLGAIGGRAKVLKPALVAGRFIAGKIGPKTAVSSKAMAGMKAAKAGKDVTAGQYKAMQAAAKASKAVKPKKLVKTKRTVAGIGAVSMVPKPKTKKTTSTTPKYNRYTREKIN